MCYGFAKLVRCLAATSLLLAAAPLWAQSAQPRHFWGAFNLGYGRMTLSEREAQDRLDVPFMGFEGGLVLSPDLLIGIELSGWLIESSNYWDSSKGEGVSQAFVTSRYYPSPYSNTFIRLGGGYVSQWHNRADGVERKTGWGATLGAGYDFQVGEHVVLTPLASYTWADTEGVRYRVMTVGLGLGFGLQ